MPMMATKGKEPGAFRFDYWCEMFLWEARESREDVATKTEGASSGSNTSATEGVAQQTNARGGYEAVYVLYLKRRETECSARHSRYVTRRAVEVAVATHDGGGASLWPGK